MDPSLLATLKAQPTFVLPFLALGLISVLRSTLRFLRWIYVYFLRPGKDLKSYGLWAVVTGATDGIGKAIAVELSRKGLHLVLVGRNPNKLTDVSETIKAEFPHTKIKTVIFDFSRDQAAGLRRLRDAIDGLDVGILVNNAGTTCPGGPLYFHEVEWRWMDIVRVNVEGTTMVTRAVVVGMMERRRGAIVNIGSGASAVLPSFPLSAVYAATKAYIDNFSQSLQVEYRNIGIDVQCQLPLYVVTKMVPFKKASPFVVSPSAYARAALTWVGQGSRCAPYWSHSIQWWLASLLPDFVLNSWRLAKVITEREKYTC